MTCTCPKVTSLLAGVIPNKPISRIWQPFIPFASFGVFQRGGYFIVDVIPDKLAVISLNTIYFYDSNKGNGCLSVSLPCCDLVSIPLLLTLSRLVAVSGCEYRQTNDPGNLQFDWLDVQLGIFRDKGVKVSAVNPLSKSQLVVQAQAGSDVLPFSLGTGY